MEAKTQVIKDRSDITDEKTPIPDGDDTSKKCGNPMV
jgi:hypothetical protein